MKQQEIQSFFEAASALRECVRTGQTDDALEWTEELTVLALHAEPPTAVAARSVLASMADADNSVVSQKCKAELRWIDQFHSEPAFSI